MIKSKQLLEKLKLTKVKTTGNFSTVINRSGARPDRMQYQRPVYYSREMMQNSLNTADLDAIKLKERQLITVSINSTT